MQLHISSATVPLLVIIFLALAKYRTSQEAVSRLPLLPGSPPLPVVGNVWNVSTEDKAAVFGPQQ